MFSIGKHCGGISWGLTNRNRDFDGFWGLEWDIIRSFLIKPKSVFLSRKSEECPLVPWGPWGYAVLFPAVEASCSMDLGMWRYVSPGQWAARKNSNLYDSGLLNSARLNLLTAMVIFNELRWVDVMEKRPNTLVSMTNFHGIFLQNLFWRLIFFVYLHLFRFSVSDSHANFPYCSENRSVLNMIQKSDERSSTFEGWCA